MNIKEIELERSAYKNLASKKIDNALLDFEEIARVNPGSVAALRGMLMVFKVLPNNERFYKIQDYISGFLNHQKKIGKNPEDSERLISLINAMVMRALISSGKHPITNSQIVNKRAKGVKKFVILTCVWQREGVTNIFLSYFSKLRKALAPNVIIDLVAVGSEGDQSKRLVENYGFEYLEYPNKPVSKKWEHGINSVKSLEFDGLIIMGSDDLIDGRAIRRYIKALDDGFLFFGFQDVYFYEADTKELIYWPGYSHKSNPMPHRTLESIGLGRMLSRELLELLNFSIWGSLEANSSLDGFMHKRLIDDLKILPLKYENNKNNTIFVNGFNVGLYCDTMKRLKIMGVDIKSDENITPVKKIKLLNGIDIVSGDQRDYFEKKMIEFVGRDKFSMLDDIDVSVIILAHKESEFLDECIKSVINQKFNGKFEIVLASDSNEKLIDYAVKYGIEYSLSIKYRDNKSCSKNLNDAVAKCRGKYIKFVAYDDFLPQDSLQSLYDEAESSKKSLVFSNAYQYYNENKIINYIPPSTQVTIDLLAERNIIHGGSIIINRNDFIYVGGFDNDLAYAEEYDFYFKMLTHKFQFSYTNKFVYYYRRHPGQKGTFALTEEEKLFKSRLVKSIADKYKNTKDLVCRDHELTGQVVFGVASIEARVSSLVETIKSVYSQADRIYIYQNGYKNFSLISDPDKKITYESSIDTGIDQGDAGKFYFLGKSLNSFYFSIDDDLIYPPNYSDVLIKKINSSKQNIIVSCHGRVFRPQGESWFDDVSTNFRCLDCEQKDVVLQFGGTGVMAFHTSYFSPPFNFFRTKNMADSWVGLLAKAEGIKIVGISHPEGWIKTTDSFDYLDDKKTIFSERVKQKAECYENTILKQFNKLVFGLGSDQIESLDC